MDPVFAGRARVSDQLADHLRERIVRGDIAPGEILVQALWADKLGVSRTPIRDAFRQLARDGLLVESNGNRTMTVAAPGPDELDEMLVARAYIEALACRLITRRGLDSGEDQALISNLEKMEDATRKGPDGTSTWFAENGRFHAAIVRASHNRILVKQQYLIGVTSLARRAQFELDAELEFQAKSDREHRSILAAIRTRDSERAYYLMCSHIYPQEP
jgi:GntR family transcriptional regulator of vanillate catabolism